MNVFDGVTNWRAETRPHGYKDGTTETWTVVGNAYDAKGHKSTVRLADWMTEPTARLIALAPQLYWFALKRSQLGDQEATELLKNLATKETTDT